ncbi:glycerol-3-phosphate 1-O-acyltransferase PlsY [Thermosediminibacter litoriperuensis]|uniref:Glycerol-3-phosphate acyltransferase n=1 Tax=Thermosediminibacter litoriperuensis TaxID=291989 RepID=A0A5S5AY95_9FIRM|nr:glycerol-3-phosphate 1-O-acyltransferase PlsY [Thermosediminibacter litoriperuensis]TYP58840.1 acyl-phosphate glycerol-3-phosphate acyltransferase [Thermosediminibacter litoriperuensis]
MLKYILAGIISYLIGSISSAHLICKKYYGIDIRKYGSGNPGATNVFRVVGGRAAVAVYAADFLKGFLVAALAKLIGGDTLALFSGLFVIVGHDWSLFLNFNGGKGIATSMGVVIALAPKAALFSFMVGAAAILLTRYVSLGSVVGSAFFPLFLVIFRYPAKYIAYGVIIAAIAIYRHRTNIKRLIAGKEHKLGEKIRP